MLALFTSLIILGAMILLGIYFSNWIKDKTNNKLIYRLLAGYLIGLIAITIAYLTIAQPKLTKNIQYTNTPYLFDLLYAEEDTIGELPDEFIKEEWELPPEVEQLTLRYQNRLDHMMMFDVIVEEHEGKQGKVVLYETPTTISGIDVSDHVPLNDINVKGELITVTGSDYVEVDFLTIKNEMTLAQFLRDSTQVNLDYFDVHIGEQVLLVKVPKNMKLNANEDQFYLHYK